MELRERLMLLVERLRNPKAPPPYVVQQNERLDEVERRLEDEKRRRRLQMEADTMRRR